MGRQGHQPSDPRGRRPYIRMAMAAFIIMLGVGVFIQQVTSAFRGTGCTSVYVESPVANVKVSVQQGSCGTEQSPSKAEFPALHF